MSSVVQRTEKYAKTLAVDLRKKGFSYSEIKKTIFVPKSTLSNWLKKIKLTEVQAGRLKKKRLEAARAGSAKRILKIAQAIEEIKNSSARDIKKISNRELWLMGIMLYWRERFLRENESDARKGVRFTSSDPFLVKLFLKWLKDVGRIKDEEIGFDIFMEKNKHEGGKHNIEDKNKIAAEVAEVAEVINYWSEITNFPKDNFTRIYFQKVRLKIRGVKKRKVSKKAHFGLLRIRVKASSMLARQIAGWIRGVQKYYWG